jgi:hypothetical protein
MSTIGRRSFSLSRIGYTPSQAWAKRNGACLDGRRRLGKLSIYTYWQRTCNLSDLQWIASRLKPLDPAFQHEYTLARQTPGRWAKGAWRYPSRMRKALIAIMSSYDVQWPTEIL